MMSTSDSELDKISSRYLIEYPTKGWQRISMKKFAAIYHEQEQVSEFANLKIRYANAYVYMDGRRVKSLGFVELGEMVFGSNGRVDKEKMMNRIIKKLNSVADSQAVKTERQVPDDVMKAVLLKLGLPRSDLNS